MIKKVDEQDYSKPSTEINYETKKRGKRRRGADVEDEYPKHKTLAPYKREPLNLLIEDEHDLIYESEVDWELREQQADLAAEVFYKDYDPDFENGYDGGMAYDE